MKPEREQTRDKAQRRVYVLPAELVERIVAFQQEKNYPSEVEAVRKLLDEALLHRDTADTIINRFRERLRNLRMPAEIAKDVLVGHPLVSNISFGTGHISFTLPGNEQFSIFEDGEVQRRVGTSWELHSRNFQDEEDLPF